MSPFFLAKSLHCCFQYSHYNRFAFSYSHFDLLIFAELITYKLNSYQVNFDFVYSIEVDSMVCVFKTLEATGLRTFLSHLIIIYDDIFLEFYFNATVTASKHNSSNMGGKTILTHEALFDSTFSLHNQELSDISQLSQPTIS